MATTISKHHFISVKTPNWKVSEQWLLEKLQKSFTDKLNKHYGVDGIKEGTASVSLSRGNIGPNIHLAMLIGLDEDKERMEAQFLFSTSCLAASVEAKVR